MAEREDTGECGGALGYVGLSGSDVAAITVPTLLRDGLPDLGYVEAASMTLVRYLRRGATVIV
jgi:UDP-N-acetyl-D-glucosamine dehydrogenase